MHYQSIMKTSCLIGAVVLLSWISSSDCTNVTERSEISEWAFREKLNPNYLLIGAPLLPLIQVVALKEFGQPWISPSTRQVDLWNGDIYGPENSQHLTDWYTFVHIVRGFIMYHATGLLPWEDVQPRFLMTIAAESLWEIVENSPYFIRKYREGSSGDSIINSFSDNLATAVGFWIAHLLPSEATLALAVAEELFLGYNIRDNLLTNIINMLFPNNRLISDWQSELLIKS